jgi:hypothetical protein
MIGKLALFVLVAVATTTIAFADPINGTQQEDFTCPAANCTTVCVGPGGQQSISNYRDLSAWMIGQPDRLWLMMDSSRVIVLGVGDRCTFAGTPRVISAPTEVIVIPPVPPQCTCIGNVCNPPGCKH